jgi:hypothetical protein
MVVVDRMHVWFQYDLGGRMLQSAIDLVYPCRGREIVIWVGENKVHTFLRSSESKSDLSTVCRIECLARPRGILYF